MTLKNIIILLLLSFSQTSVLLSQFCVESEINNRFEINNGYRQLATPNTPTALSMQQRTRLVFKFSNNLLKLKITPQDVRIWGDETMFSNTSHQGDNASIEMYEGFFELKLFDDNWLSIGRQEIKFDNERIFSVRNWNMYGNTYDALILKFNIQNCAINVGATWNSLNTKNNLYPSVRIKNINFLHLNKTFGDNSNWSLIYVAAGRTPNDTTFKLFYKHTVGFYSKLVSNNTAIQADAYFQFGKNTRKQNVNAFLIGVTAEQSMGNICLQLAGDYISGDNNLNDNTEKLFDLLYGIRHRLYGHLDYFTDFPKETKNGGLVDVRFGLKYKFLSKFEIQNDLYYFWLAQINTTTPAERKLGLENDLLVRFKATKWLELRAEYMFFVPEKNLIELQGLSKAAFSHFGYIQIIITPTLFQQ